MRIDKLAKKTEKKLSADKQRVEEAELFWENVMSGDKDLFRKLRETSKELDKIINKDRGKIFVFKKKPKFEFGWEILDNRDFPSLTCYRYLQGQGWVYFSLNINKKHKNYLEVTDEMKKIERRIFSLDQYEKAKKYFIKSIFDTVDKSDYTSHINDES